MRSLEELFKTPRMFYLPLDDMNSVVGLNELCNDIVGKGFVIVEVGSFAGVSSDLFARYCNELHCVDIWNDPDLHGLEKHYAEAAELMFDDVWEEHRNINPIIGLSVEVAKMYEDESVDMVYIDAAHDYQNVRNDIVAWMPKVGR